jgi:type II secretory pathway component PulJ
VSRRAGFTLVEIVLAMGILVLGASAILGMLTFGAALTRTAQLRATAAAAVAAVEADLDQVLFPYEGGEVGEPIPITDRAVPGAEDLVYSAQARPNPEHEREYRVDVTIAWKSGGVRRTKSYTTLKLRQIGFGERLRREFVEPQRIPETGRRPPVPGSE